MLVLAPLVVRLRRSLKLDISVFRLLSLLNSWQSRARSHARSRTIRRGVQRAVMVPIPL